MLEHLLQLQHALQGVRFTHVVRKSSYHNSNYIHHTSRALATRSQQVTYIYSTRIMQLILLYILPCRNSRYQQLHRRYHSKLTNAFQERDSSPPPSCLFSGCSSSSFRHPLLWLTQRLQLLKALSYLSIHLSSSKYNSPPWREKGVRGWVLLYSLFLDSMVFATVSHLCIYYYILLFEQLLTHTPIYIIKATSPRAEK